jgi:DNA-binding response OmpR family regulator
MKILIIEDEENLAKLLKLGLARQGYAVDYVLDGEQGEKRIAMHHTDYDLVVCDLMLPKKNGLEICKNIRSYNISLPILVLTARDSVEDKVSLLDAGADDYIVKPFHFEEVLARIRALTRRPEQVLPTELKTGNLTLNAATRRVTRDGEEVSLTLKEFRLLEYFMRHPNQVLGREDIIENIWDFDFDSMSNIIDVYINRLRYKVGGEDGARIIETVRGVGYRLKV